MTDATDAQQMVIVGAGLAGTGAAATLRKEGYTGRVVLISSDAAQPYDHVPLSKNHLRDEPGYHRLFLHDPAFYREQRIDLRLDTTVTAIDAAAHRIRTDGGGGVAYDKLLLATGSHNRPLELPGSDLDGIFSLRTLGEADRLKAALARARRLVVVGAGFVGCEVAASARQLGVDVTLVGSRELPMLHVLGPVGAAYYRDVHQAHGVHLCMPATASEFRGTDGRVRWVVLSDGTELPADVVVVGVGALPDVQLAEAAGIPVDDGILTDDTLATGVADVYAAGDVAAVPYRALGRRLRVEHFATALSQGPVAGRNMLGGNVPYGAVPFFFSDQYDVWMEYTGHNTGDTDTVIRGDVADGRFVVFWLRGSQLVAAMNINIRGVPDIVTPLIAEGIPVDRAALVDPKTDLAYVAG
ncbi:NAD(P)/FAD-dependent oxidoreductase [Microbacterium terrisoli]|uniref:NAD(P)/FAD-dependent oxidoreductase n=1 Tax=Microbacterium terrisoli TaxID=3242192 RepID=UPI00280427A7|nr:FAD-dependent oxidoreductase [Microbacterium protaetiae]